MQDQRYQTKLQDFQREMEKREMRKNSRKGTSLPFEKAVEIFKNTEKIQEVALKEMRAVPLYDQDDMALELTI